MALLLAGVVICYYALFVEGERRSKAVVLAALAAASALWLTARLLPVAAALLAFSGVYAAFRSLRRFP